MDDSIHKFHQLMSALKEQQDKSPMGSLKSFVHFLKELKALIKSVSKEEREHVFKEFQKHQGELQSAMKGLQLDPSKLQNPEDAQRIREQVTSPEFQSLIKQMSEELFEIVKIVSDGKMG